MEKISPANSLAVFQMKQECSPEKKDSESGKKGVVGAVVGGVIGLALGNPVGGAAVGGIGMALLSDHFQDEKCKAAQEKVRLEQQGVNTFEP